MTAPALFINFLQKKNPRPFPGREKFSDLRLRKTPAESPREDTHDRHHGKPGEHSDALPDGIEADHKYNRSAERRAGIDMLYKYHRTVARKDIAQNSASDSGQHRDEEHKKEISAEASLNRDSRAADREDSEPG